MADGDGGWFLGNRAPELHETAQACCHQPCTIPHKTVCQMDAWFSSYGKNKFCSMCFCFKALCILVAWDDKMNFGCDAGIEMMEEELEDCMRTSKPLRKLPCSPNHFLKCMPSFPQFLQEVPVEAQWEAQGGGKNDGERQGMDTQVLVGLINRFPPLDSLLKLDLARPKVLQDVSCRNTELPVEGIRKIPLTLIWVLLLSWNVLLVTCN